ncbi:MAG TPA: PD-(D/E)XK nuclease family protein, partial [Steroidobacteraceae bacterium]|nr:PD-(D/E)XK nuclease family protein [Steroidobacteraceae bacterium]
AARGDPIEFAAAGDRPADVEVAAARDAETELAMAADWARRQVESGAGAVCVVVPDLAARLAAVRRAFEDCFVPGARRIGSRRHAGAFEIAATRRLDQFPHVDAALELLELARGRGPSALAGRIVLSPFLGGAIAEANARARLELRLRSDGREHFGVDELERLASAAACPVLTERLAAARALLRGAPRRATASVWAERFLELLGAFGWPGDAPLDSDERQTVEQVRDACGLFGALDEVLGDLDFDRARYEFRRLVSAQHFEPRTLPAPVTVIDPDTVVGVEFDALWIAGMDAGRWPPAPDPDPLLPIALQIEAGMPWATANAAREHARQRFDRVLKGAARAIASWPQWDGDAEQRPSPWLAGLPTAGLDQPVTRAYRATLYDARPALETIEDPGLPPLASPHAVGGARALELQALCPFRAQVELRLRARPLEQSGPEVDPLERGDLAHRALERLWRELGGHAGLMGRTTDSLATTVRAVVQQCAQPLLTGATAHRARLVAIEVDLACERIGELLECERGRRPFRIQGPEVRGALALGGLEFDLRIDRIDELDDGSRIVIDYKTGASASARHWYGERPRQPQLPLYALAYADVAAVAVAQLARGAVGFEGVARDAGLLPGIDAWPSRANPTDAADWPGLIEHWRVNLERLAREHRDGVSRVDPLPQACRYCHLSLLCRIDEHGSHDADATVALDE